MKRKISIVLINIITLLFLFILFACRKNDSIDPSNIILYNKPLTIIQHCIHGKWKLAYAKGGICSTCKYYCDSCFVEFTSSNKIICNSYVTTDGATTIHWIRDIGTYTNNEYTYLMSFSDKQGVPWVYVIDRIYNDTLIYHDNSGDAMFYYYVRLK